MYQIPNDPDSLARIFEQQRDTQTNLYHTLPQDYWDDEVWPEAERAIFVRDNVLAALDELHEALSEVGWKPWATSRHVNEEQLKGELVDVLHFFVNLCLAARMSSRELTERYFTKNERNHARQAAEGGYDGISGKCPGCHRAYDDGVGCSGSGLRPYCTELKAFL